MTEPLSNWAGNLIYNAAGVYYPDTVEQIQELVARSDKLRALGSRHSFNTIADTSGDLISLARLNRVIALDRERRTVTVEAGIRYGELAEYLHGAGFALQNMASLPHISVAGACATGTHGSGDRNGILATAVTALETVIGTGEMVVLSREQQSEQFAGAVVGLGGAGVVTQVTLGIEPAYEMRQVIYEHLPLAQLEAHFDEITTSAYSVSLFTDWHSTTINQVWLKSRVAPGEPFEPVPELYGATPALTRLHPIAALSAANCTEQRAIPGPWYERLPHFRLGFTPSSGEELQSEYMLPRRNALAGLQAIATMREQITPLLLISEIRTIAADEFWMSPCYRQDSVALHFTWQKDWPAVSRLLPLIEARLEPLQARPHWGKLFTLAPAYVQSRYEKLAEFRHELQNYDPSGKFRNSFLDTYIFNNS